MKKADTEVASTRLTEVLHYLDNTLVHKDFDNLKDLHGYFENLELQDWKELVVFNEEKYNRITLKGNAIYDLLLICWKPGQGSSFHPHSQHGCLLKVLQGELTEEFKCKKDSISTNIYTADKTIYIDNEMGIHCVYNNSIQPTVSLHLYAPGGFMP